MNQHVDITAVCVLGAGELCRIGYSTPLWTNKIPGLGPTCAFQGRMFLNSLPPLPPPPPPPPSPKILALGLKGLGGRNKKLCLFCGYFDFKFPSPVPQMLALEGTIHLTPIIALG